MTTQAERRINILRGAGALMLVSGVLRIVIGGSLAAGGPAWLLPLASGPIAATIAELAFAGGFVAFAVLCWRRGSRAVAVLLVIYGAAALPLAMLGQVLAGGAGGAGAPVIGTVLDVVWLALGMLAAVLVRTRSLMAPRSSWIPLAVVIAHVVTVLFGLLLPIWVLSQAWAIVQIGVGIYAIVVTRRSS